ncbi:HypC/HybG/HupF family hydrogenase formation chaperone, partial [Sutterella wadsworthensis]|uniref:HypC/HybG/HupF family hydrogenase formation chaperone n=3 Tax=Sutterella wadsworthensis TaxID=40545 RepID=UPI0013F68168
MCIALPMKVLESGPMMVVCERNGRRLEVDCSMIDQPAVGAWLLVFQNRALREIEEAEAGEIEAALGATARVMAGGGVDEKNPPGVCGLVCRGPGAPGPLRGPVGPAPRKPPLRPL